MMDVIVFRIIKLFILSSAITILYGCSNEQLLDVSTNEPHAIAFDSYIVHTKGASVSNNNLTDFGIIAYHTGVNNYDDKQRGNLFMDNTKIIKKGELWKPFDKEYYWPNDTDLFSFFAYAPHNESSSWLSYDNVTNNITLTVDANGSNHIDFLYTHTLDQSEKICGASGINLNFDHLLTKITVSARLTENILNNGDYQIKRIIIGNIYYMADLPIGNLENQSWIINRTEKNSVLASIDNKMLTTNFLTNNYTNIFNNGQALFMIPQYLDNSSIYLDVLHPDGVVYRSEAIIKMPLDNQNLPCWKQGVAYDYRITYNGMESVAFSIECAVGKWNEQYQEENIDDIYLNLSDYKLEIFEGTQRNIHYFTDYSGIVKIDARHGTISAISGNTFTYTAPIAASNDIITVTAGNLKRQIIITVTN